MAEEMFIRPHLVINGCSFQKKSLILETIAECEGQRLSYCIHVWGGSFCEVDFQLAISVPRWQSEHCTFGIMSMSLV